jgi:hypothetical protein
MPPAERFGGSQWQRLAAWAWPSHPAEWRDVPRRLRPTLLTVFRLSAAAVVAYLISQILTHGALDLTGPLTALLVVQASAFSTIKMGAVRVGAVLAGILVATLLSTWIGLTWWSLGAAIAASLLLAKVLRLGEQALETPISAMLIMGVSNHDVAAETRILNTLIGAAVGVAFNLIYPPAMPAAPARQALLRVVDAAASPLDAAADALVDGPVTRAQVEDWIDRVRSANREVAAATAVIALLKDSRRFNPRALGTVDVEPILASALDSLEHCLLAIRGLFAVLLAEVPPEEEPDDPYGGELRAAFAVVLHDTADCLRAFGSLVIAEAEGREEETEQALAESLDILRETQAILTELIMVDARDDTSSWLLRGSILAAVEQVLSRLNLEDRARIHRRWQEEQQRRPLAQLPQIVQDVLPHPERPYPRGLEPGRIFRRRPVEDSPSEDPSAEVDNP